MALRKLKAFLLREINFLTGTSARYIAAIAQIITVGMAPAQSRGSPPQPAGKTGHSEKMAAAPERFPSGQPFPSTKSFVF